MASLLLHSAAVERLAQRRDHLPPEIAKGFGEDLEYARFGALLPDLPWCEGLRGGFTLLKREAPAPRFVKLFHERAPVAMGLKLAELVGNGALVGRDAGLAFVSGYFTHLCLDRALHPIVDTLVERHRRAEESISQARRRIDAVHEFFFLRDANGEDIFGTRRVRRYVQVLKSGIPTRGIGRGMYELIRLAAEDTLDVAPTKSEVDGWVRGAFVYGLVLATPLGTSHDAHPRTPLDRRELYHGDDVDIPDVLGQALDQAEQVLARLWSFIRRGVFTPRAKQRFMAELPEGSIGSWAA